MAATSSSDAYILTVNAGSSSVKLSLFAAHDVRQNVWEAAVENIGSPTAQLIVLGSANPANVGNHLGAATLLMERLSTEVAASAISAVGHRIVHGGPTYYEAQLASDEVLRSLQQLVAFDPLHLPIELELVTVFRRLTPQAQQVLCFDTAFHHDLPRRAQLLPIPRHLQAEGVRRYGFHGLSYAYILEELRRVEGEAAASGKVIVAHLGSGASLAALQNAKPIDTTMSMTPASGVPMSTRSGDLDPGLALYLAHMHGYEAKRFNQMVNFESGLLGISETTADMKQLLEIEAEDPRAKDAVDIFCYQVKKTIGSFAAALGGLNTLVFTGGMGENAPKIRARVCEGLEFLGITLDATRNQERERLISVNGAGVGVHVIHTDEAVTMARETEQLIQKSNA
ncbi:MAG TPA: acetate/propionate family kinase [Candidatus Saccharimonadales bacterium]|nr:acetate/propionate family kinase [Candidatus Saccharimonadales bacterium]